MSHSLTLNTPRNVSEAQVFPIAVGTNGDVLKGVSLLFFDTVSHHALRSPLPPRLLT